MWKNPIEAHTKMPIETKNGISDHPRSRGIHLAMGTPNLSPGSSRYVHAE